MKKDIRVGQKYQFVGDNSCLYAERKSTHFISIDKIEGLIVHFTARDADGDETGTCWHLESELHLEPYRETSIPLKGGELSMLSSLVGLTDEQKEGLTKEDQALIELGVIDSLLRLQDSAYLMGFLFKMHKKELAAQAIKEVAEFKAAQKKAAK